MTLDFDKLYDNQYTFANFNFQSFNQSIYTMIVALSGTNFPAAMVNAYQTARASVLFFILNTFIVNIILFNLILASFYFYYQSFYTGSVKRLNNKKGLVKILKKFRGKIITDDQLVYIVETYIEHPEIKWEDMDKEPFKEDNKNLKSGVEAYKWIVDFQSHIVYEAFRGCLNVVIVILTMQVIPIFNKINGVRQQGSKTMLIVQVVLILVSMIDQALSLIIRGWRKTFQSLVLTFDLIDTLVALLIGMLFLSFTDFSFLLNYQYTSSMFKVYALATICKTLSVIMFLRLKREIRIVLDVLINSAIFLIDVIGMIGIVMMLFSSVGISMFGGIVNTKSLSTWKSIMADDNYNEGIQYMNFNDYGNSLILLFTVMMAGWNDVIKITCFSMPNRGFTHNYFFVAYWICTNLFLMNVLIGFIIDNIVAYLSEDILVEDGRHSVTAPGFATTFFEKIIRIYDRVVGKKAENAQQEADIKELKDIMLTDK